MERSVERNIEFALGALTLQPWKLITLLLRSVFIDLCSKKECEEEFDFRIHFEASLPSVCDFAVLGNLKVDLLSLLPCSTERMLSFL